jgi:UDP-N-acetylmuramyl tripeptide synthase
MKLIHIQALRGANYFSQEYRKQIQLRVQFESPGPASSDLENLNRAALPEKNEIALAKLLDTISTLLDRAEMPVLFTKVITTHDTGVYVVLFSYVEESCGRRAAQLAIELMQKPDFSENDLNFAAQQLLETKEKESSNIAAAKICDQLLTHQIPCYAMDEETLQIGVGIHQKKIPLSEIKSNPDGFIELLNPADFRIPIIAVTGSNGKTTTTRLIAHILSESGETVGFTTSDGIYVGKQMIDQGDTTGPISAMEVLTHPDVSAAVLETARGGILRAGLGFAFSDISVITNIQDDHLGISDIHTLEDLSKVKEVVMHSTLPEGYTVLNADNHFTLDMKHRAKSQVALFSLHSLSHAFSAHVLAGKPGASVENRHLCIWDQGKKLEVVKVEDIPITFNGSLSFMVQNALAASLAAYLKGISVEQIAAALQTFYPSAEQTPGRMNHFEIKNVHVLVDFAHNPDGFRGVRDFLKTVTHHPKQGIIVGTGDRRDEDIIELGRLSAEMFDEIYIHQKKFLRGRTAADIIQLLKQGIQSVKPSLPVHHINDDDEPLTYVLNRAQKGSLIVALSDVLDDPIGLMRRIIENDETIID